MVRKAALIVALALAGCGQTDDASTATMYRNSTLEPSMRVHFASYDADESDLTYNMNNCQMAARLLNANVRALHDGEDDPVVGFWCENGAYKEVGTAAFRFDAEFPTVAQ